MMKACIFGASGYTGVELVKILHKHPTFELSNCYVSEGSADKDKRVNDVHACLDADCNYVLQAASERELSEIAAQHDAVFLALPHEVSHHWAPKLLEQNVRVFDLSGAYRLSDLAIFEQAYCFANTYPDTVQDAVYGLAEWNKQAIQAASMVAVPGCYPTASLIGIKPIVESELLADNCIPVINATSGVSGAGRKASSTTSFYEVSLTPYGVLNHRHTPEIEEHAKTKVIFTPHLGAFKRGILATTTMFLKETACAENIAQAYSNAYANSPIVRIRSNWPKVDELANTPYCDIYWKYDTEKRCLVVCTAIDNLLKGAASQAVQCANLAFGMSEEVGLI
ncbi:N-acetyl-gamma-glutamyl-phosphate reductase [Agaribacter flavus]|uniref:N-acetyl-gamma-glutamyl-phosphate reductase n=1 Tax=Agaribacter flavus TaxID=1902781 RepID=A0ABV7FW61_9ALTE